MNEPSVSVIIPAYNAGNFLAETIDSVLGQSRPPYELIVVNDGSLDDTAAVARAFGNRIRHFDQANLGSSVARNRGVEESTGTFLAFLDADDIWESRKLEVQLDAFRAEPELDMVFAHMQEFDERRNGTPLVSAPKPARFSGTCMIRRASFLRVGPFAPGLKIAEWLDWCLRAKEAGLRDRMLSQVLMQRRIHGRNTGLLQMDERKNLARVLKKSLDRRRVSLAGRGEG